LARGLAHGLAGAAVAVWPAVALVGSCELLMMVIRSAQVPGQPRAQQLRAFLGTLDGNPAGCWGVRYAALRLKPALGHPVMDCRRFG
jgi:hypothetical protein